MTIIRIKICRQTGPYGKVPQNRFRFVPNCEQGIASGLSQVPVVTIFCFCFLETSMFESMWSSMSSSIQLAEDCLKTENEAEAPNSEDAAQTFEGLERFAQTIDSSK